MKGLSALALTAVVFFCSCNQQPVRHRLDRKALLARRDSLRDDLLKTDISFSQYSEDKGRNAAFLAFADSSATMLRSFSEPVSGKEGIAQLLSKYPDTAVKVTWLPIASDVALSGELGYTYGTYTIEDKNTDRFGGTYCTVWKRSRANGWKFLLSTGNVGVKPQD